MPTTTAPETTTTIIIALVIAAAMPTSNLWQVVADVLAATDNVGTYGRLTGYPTGRNKHGDVITHVEVALDTYADTKAAIEAINTVKGHRVLATRFYSEDQTFNEYPVAN